MLSEWPQPWSRPHGVQQDSIDLHPLGEALGKQTGGGSS